MDEKILVERHGTHNQKTHGNRYGAGQAKESLRRLKDDKKAREQYKARARERKGKSISASFGDGLEKDQKNIDNIIKLVESGDENARITADALTNNIIFTVQAARRRKMFNRQEAKRYNEIMRGQESGTNILSSGKSGRTAKLKTAKKLLPILYDVAARSKKADITRAQALLPTCKALLTLKYGARNSRPDLSMLQQVHDLTVRLGAVCGDGLKKNAFFVEQHLAGKHNQKRHAWRYGGTKDARRSMRGADKREREEYKARARSRNISEASSEALYKTLQKTPRQEQRTTIAKNWVKTNEKEAEPYKKHGMSKTQEKAKAVEYRGLNITYPDTAQGRLNAAKSLALLEAPKAPYDESPLPDSLIKVTNGVYLTNQKNAKDAYWAEKYNMPGLTSRATGGDGYIVVYDKGAIGRGTFAHEAGHNLATKVYGQTEPPPKSVFFNLNSKWLNDTPGAEAPVRDYGTKSIAEDWATSVEMYVTRPSKMKNIAPKRFKIMQEVVGGIKP